MDGEHQSPGAAAWLPGPLTGGIHVRAVAQVGGPTDRDKVRNKATPLFALPFLSCLLKRPDDLETVQRRLGILGDSGKA